MRDARRRKPTLELRTPASSLASVSSRHPRHRSAAPAPLKVECWPKCETIGRERALFVAIGQLPPNDLDRFQPMMTDDCRWFSHSSDTDEWGNIGAPKRLGRRW